uniref:Uncharacterized protein n=1 Tax=Anguilla anguilla TaxID=7936 RepID=A0A0E9TS85_ANGAN
MDVLHYGKSKNQTFNLASQPAYFHIPKIILYFMIFYTELKS